MNIKKTIDPKIDHLGTPDFIYTGLGMPWTLSIAYWRLCKYNVGKFKTVLLHLYKENLSISKE